MFLYRFLYLTIFSHLKKCGAMKRNNFVLDIGNSHIVAAVFQNSKMLRSWRFATDKTKTKDEYGVIINSFFSNLNLEIQQIDRAAISSVVPVLTGVFEKMFTEAGIEKITLVSAYTPLGLRFPMSDPGFVGADLVVNAFAAKEKYQQNCIVCDFGTATTMQLVGKDGFFYGTVIMPGVMISATRLFDKAALLTNIDLEAPTTLLGTNTQDSLLSGIIRGNAFMIDGFIRKIKEEHSNLKPIKVIATGGISQLICQQSEEIDEIDENLTLTGLNRICERE
ncbi:MAG: type pantothenate kinase [Candidatus Cloacimonadota bacterium]|nr:type pantothenate kinase [Candidatus Cloacimonadota bacterium]